MIHFKEKSQPFWAIAGLVLVVGVGVVDVLTGYELAFSLFYLFPIALVTWFGGIKIGVATAVISDIGWFAADAVTGHPYSYPAIPYWNAGIRFSVFLIVALLIAALRKAYENEKELARIDNLTGAVNTLFFYELVQMEIARSQRNKQPFTIAYVDLDNFKSVNDNFGHNMGDEVLCTTVQQAKLQLRKIDAVARLGGDEFASLLPETDKAEAQVAISKIQIRLLDEMRKNSWPVTFSIGVLTCIDMPQKTTDELIRRADDLMYSVKNSGKNSIRYSVYAG